jgi:hypothetical protein
MEAWRMPEFVRQVLYKRSHHQETRGPIPRAWISADQAARG